MLEHPRIASACSRAYPPEPYGANGGRRRRRRRDGDRNERGPLDDLGNAHEEIEALALDDVLPLGGGGEEGARDGAAEPGEVLEDLALRVLGHKRARAHERGGDRSVHVRRVRVRGVLPEHPRNALVVRRRLAQHGREVRRGRAPVAHAERLRHRGRVDAAHGHVRRVPRERAEQRALAGLELVDVLHRRVRDAAQPEPALVDRLRREEERRGEGHHGAVEEDAERGGVAGVARLGEDVGAEAAIGVEPEREGYARRVGQRVLVVVVVVVIVVGEERGMRGLAGG